MLYPSSFYTSHTMCNCLEGLQSLSYVLQLSVFIQVPQTIPCGGGRWHCWPSVAGHPLDYSAGHSVRPRAHILVRRWHRCRWPGTAGHSLTRQPRLIAWKGFSDKRDSSRQPHVLHSFRVRMFKFLHHANSMTGEARP